MTKKTTFAGILKITKKMANDNTELPEDKIESFEHALSRTEQYIEENQKSLMIIVGAIVVIIAAYFGYKKLYLAPLEDEAQKQIYVAQQYFEKDSFKTALNGDGNYPGFVTIADDYGITKAGNLSDYYAGICYLRLGQFENAIKYLKKFDTKDKLLAPIALGAIGDAYSELGKNDDAVKFYLKAANLDDNEFIAPVYLLKAGQVYEEKADFENALKVYEKIQTDYPRTLEGRQIDKYITRAKIKLNKA